jgi:hypothetical protein
MKRRLLLTIGLALFALGGGLLRAQPVQPLPPADWYAVLHTPDDGRLHWASPAGVVASSSLPALPEQAASAEPALHVSRDGSYLVVAAERIDGRQGIGFWDFEAGTWSQTHIAQPGERILLGQGPVSDAASRHVAVGFATRGQGWRLLIFDMRSGDVVAGLAAQSAPEALPQAAEPHVRLYRQDIILDEALVAFDLVPDDGGAPLPFVWDVTTGFVWPEPQAPPAPADRLATTGAGVYVIEVATGAPPPAGSGGDALVIQRGGERVIPWRDTQAIHHDARWAAGGGWILFRTSQGDDAFWNVVLTNSIPEDNTRYGLPPGLRDVAGTPDGLVALSEEGALLASDQFGAPLEVIGSDLAGAHIAYVTPPGSLFSLRAVVDAGPGQALAGAAGSQPCAMAPPTQLTLGLEVQVAELDGGSLRLRDAPGGAEVGLLAPGTALTLLEGPRCEGVAVWWRVRLPDVTEGWVAEGAPGQPYLVPVTPADATPAPAVSTVPAATMAPMATATPAITATPLACPSAPAGRLHAGDAISVVLGEGRSLPLRFGPDEAAFLTVPGGTRGRVLGDARCGADGGRYWPLLFVINGLNQIGWASEGTNAVYWLAPVN